MQVILPAPENLILPAQDIFDQTALLAAIESDLKDLHSAMDIRQAVVGHLNAARDTGMAVIANGLRASPLAARR